MQLKSVVGVVLTVQRLVFPPVNRVRSYLAPIPIQTKSKIAYFGLIDKTSLNY